jgi:hypothetical protein
VFYYALLLMLGNEIAPVSTLQIVFASALAIFGALFGAFLFGNMAALMEAMNRRDDLEEEMNNNSLDIMKSL